MSKRPKNLILIFEKGKIKYDVSSNLVRLYMNRCIIAEEDQFEILGVVKIGQNSWTKYSWKNAFERKIAMHAKVASKIIKKSDHMQKQDTHLIGR